MKTTTIDCGNGFTKNHMTTDSGIFIPAFNETFGMQSDFYLSFAPTKNETALCIPGSDGIPVLIIVVDGDHRDELKSICDANQTGKNGNCFALGECLRWITHHKTLIKQGSGTLAFPDYLTIK